jgi:hypothetical protein
MKPVIYEQIMSMLGLIALWAFWYYLWKPQRIDIVRQKLFALRSKLFDVAADGVVSFDDPAYTQLRLLLNGMIRFAHRASFPALVVAAAQASDAPSDSLMAWKKSVQKLPEGARSQLLVIYSGASEALAKHLIGGSVLLFFYVLLRVLCAMAKAFFLLLAGKRDLRNFTVSRVRNKMDWERDKVAKSGTGAIESRVLHEEQRRTEIKRQPAYAH